MELNGVARGLAADMFPEPVADHAERQRQREHFRDALDRERHIGVAVMSKRGETIRLNYFGGLEDTAKYATDLQEALALGKELAGPRRHGSSGR
jgi:hypothetical protein